MPEQTGRTLTFVALAASIAGALIAVSHSISDERIEANRQARLLARLDEVLGTLDHDNDVVATRHVIAAPDPQISPGPSEYFLAMRAGRSVGAVLACTAPNGYNGPIELLVGVAADGSITGVRVVSHRETPGLGDAIEAARSSWIDGFVGASLRDPPPSRWSVSKDGGHFDSITGATVTPRAIVEAVRGALSFFRDHRTEILAGQLGRAEKS